ncbi:hypothetical protein PIB30_028668 [Stylosanthes scabra]|uniref:Uncharacterized protein n=1 Tax=Stylosanthes scabra TaxID=79078 RepID=A0ABU6SAX7_9FABA|nr:hypothetical protein [Stylosanthes scabra]
MSSVTSAASGYDQNCLSHRRHHFEASSIDAVPRHRAVAIASLLLENRERERRTTGRGGRRVASVSSPPPPPFKTEAIAVNGGAFAQPKIPGEGADGTKEQDRAPQGHGREGH